MQKLLKIMSLDMFVSRQLILLLPLSGREAISHRQHRIVLLTRPKLVYLCDDTSTALRRTEGQRPRMRDLPNTGGASLLGASLKRPV